MANTYVPSHPDFAVDFRPGAYTSSLRSLKVCFRYIWSISEPKKIQAFKAGQVLAHVKGITKQPKTYATVQYGLAPDDNLDLNSDLRFST